MSNWVTHSLQDARADTFIGVLGDRDRSAYGEVLNKSMGGSVGAKFHGTWYIVVEFENASADPPAIVASSSETKVTERIPDIDANLGEIFKLARWESFEDGVESDFSRALLSFIEQHGRLAMEAVDFFIRSASGADEIIAEALRWLGHMGGHPQTYEYRFYILVKSLEYLSPQVRDGALLGLSFLDDLRAVPPIEEAIKNEKCEGLREDMKQVIQQW